MTKLISNELWHMIGLSERNRKSKLVLSYYNRKLNKLQNEIFEAQGLIKMMEIKEKNDAGLTRIVTLYVPKDLVKTYEKHIKSKEK